MSKGQKAPKPLPKPEVFIPLGSKSNAVQVCKGNLEKVKQMLGPVLANTEGVIIYSDYYSDTCGEEAPYLQLVFTLAGKDYFIKQGDRFLRGTVDQFWVWTPEEYGH